MIDAAHIHKALMIARLGNFSVFDDHDVISMSNSIEPVSDYKQCFAFAKLRDSLLDVAFVVGVNACCSFIENDNGRILQNTPCDRIRIFGSFTNALAIERRCA